MKRLTFTDRVARSAQGQCAAPHLRHFAEFIRQALPKLRVVLRTEVKHPTVAHYGGHRLLVYGKGGKARLDHSTVGTAKRNTDVSRWLIAMLPSMQRDAAAELREAMRRVEDE